MSESKSDQLRAEMLERHRAELAAPGWKGLSNEPEAEATIARDAPVRHSSVCSLSVGAPRCSPVFMSETTWNHR